MTGEQSQVMLERLRDGVQNLYYICEETRATNRHGATISGGRGDPGRANKIGVRLRVRERLSVCKNKLQVKETGHRQGSARARTMRCGLLCVRQRSSAADEAIPSIK
jgi:hypothetical protein